MSPNTVLEFWFITHNGKWFQKSPEFDAEIKTTFETALQQATAGELNNWLDTAESRLAFIILLDQFSRNIYRDTPQAFAQDPLAIETAKAGIALGQDKQIPLGQRMFFYMPFMHSENLAEQKEGLALFQSIADEADESERERFNGTVNYSQQHLDIVAEFGRFPHRNKILGRETTAEEATFLQQPGSSF